MAFLLTIAYCIIITGLGMGLAKRFRLPACEQLILAFLLGSLLAGFYFYSLAAWHYVTPAFIWGFVAFCLIATIITSNQLIKNSKNTALFLHQYLLQKDRYCKLFILVLGILLAWIILLAITPPRSADAMRYHLAQIKDIIWHQGFVFRPYLHYHFPLYFSLIFLPVFVIAKGVGLKIAVCFYFLLSLLVLTRIAYRVQLKHPRFLLLFLFLTPLAYHEAHIVTNDWVVVAYVLMGFLFLLVAQEDQSLINLILAFLSLGIALGVKYQAILFVPWFFLLSFKVPLKNRLHIIWALLLMGLIASPFYLQNWIVLHNPVFPLASSLFGCHGNYFCTLAQAFTKNMSGTHQLSSWMINLKSFLFYPLIPITVWLLVFAGVALTRVKKLMIGIGFITYFILWWLLEPVFYIRFSFYILPLGLIAAVKLYEQWKAQKKTWALWCYKIIVFVSFLYFIPLAICYSSFYAKYYWQHNLNSYHQYTWYYQDYNWINQNLPQKAKVLCIAQAGQTYYLNRPYLRADALSALINWSEVKTPKALQRILQSLKINYIFYDENTLSPASNKIIRQWMRSRRAKRIIWQRKEKLYTSRIKKQFTNTTVYLIKVI